MSQTDMTAIAVEGGKGSAADMKAVRLPRPEAGPGQILIRVAHAGVNRPDRRACLRFTPSTCSISRWQYPPDCPNP